MKERPILFSDEMVKAILSGRKTQTRRVVNLTDGETGCPAGYAKLTHSHVARLQDGVGLVWRPFGGSSETPMPPKVIAEHSPYGDIGDRLWVREAWCSPSTNIVGYRADAECGAWMGDGAGGRIWNHHGLLIESPAYQSRFANDQRWTTYSLKKYGGRWRPSIHMYRWASRITLEVTGVRVERLQQISREDSIAEGVEWNDTPLRFGHTSPVSAYKSLWESINGKGSWDLNPWVWVVSFTKGSA